MIRNICLYAVIRIITSQHLYNCDKFFSQKYYFSRLKGTAEDLIQGYVRVRIKLKNFFSSKKIVDISLSLCYRTTTFNVQFFHFYSTLLCSGKSGKNSFIAHKQKEGLSCTMHIIAQITLNTVRLFLLAPKISSHKKEIVTRENIF